ncbi:MAG: hypothetical protein HC880_20625 [Bacteroidia bacterium]|nr:hypothetical protein [Bacteroidia bacterium]
MKKGLEIGLEKGLEKGLEIGEFNKTVKGIQNFLVLNVLTVEQIAQAFEVTVEFVQQVQSGEISLRTTKSEE